MVEFISSKREDNSVESEERLWLNWFIRYLEVERNSSKWTIDHYTKDVEQFYTFLSQQGLSGINETTHLEVRSYISSLVDRRYARRTIARKLSALRSFGKFLLREQLVKENPFLHAHLPKQEERLPRFLYEEEMDQWLTALPAETALEKEIRRSLSYFTRPAFVFLNAACCMRSSFIGQVERYVYLEKVEKNGMYRSVKWQKLV